jgi:hypothetical protein
MQNYFHFTVKVLHNFIKELHHSHIFGHFASRLVIPNELAILLSGLMDIDWYSKNDLIPGDISCDYWEVIPSDIGWSDRECIPTRVVRLTVFTGTNNQSPSFSKISRNLCCQ